ncbi:MAG: hypothetical protein A3J74_11100 [Elusimicrobia bacterium RIFCSPHIGHO2_02_FULL_57_9]|nr:MAG: hypothetical protein A3J74_11100 [Elusimicrobia bacterium RIFCSPHIGHO2_02_FULL_57_9]
MDFSQFKDIFIGEAQDILGRVEEILVRLEQAPGDGAMIQELFRVVHTLKGNAATLDLKKMTELAHGFEDRLDAVAKGSALITPRVLDAFLACLDRLRLLLREVQEEKDYQVDVRNALKQLEAAFGPQAGSGSEPSPAPLGAPRQDASANTAVATTVRVRLKRLDNIMNLVSELAIAKARVVRKSQSLHYSGNLADDMKELEGLINQLQQEALETRMVPILEIFTRYQRVVRDASRAMGKNVQFKIEDNGISVDRILLEKINEPLVHLLRNAVDHAIEGPEERARASKPAAGAVILRAGGERGYVIIEVSDDGRGMDPVRIKDKALALGIVSCEEAGKLSKRQILDLICHPSFSTAEKVTEMSGRGVGMSVVRQIVEGVKGRLEISSQPGQGSVFSLYLPLSLAILQALLVRVCDEIFAVPLTDVLELISLRVNRPKIVDKTPMISLRGELLPLISVASAFGLSALSPTSTGYAVIVQSMRGKRALHVDGLVGREEIVVKNFSGFLKMAKGFSSSTIRGDGRVALILDVRGLK